MRGTTKGLDGAKTMILYRLPTQSADILVLVLLLLVPWSLLVSSSLEFLYRRDLCCQVTSRAKARAPCLSVRVASVLPWLGCVWVASISLWFGPPQLGFSVIHALCLHSSLQLGGVLFVWPPRCPKLLIKAKSSTICVKCRANVSAHRPLMCCFSCVLISWFTTWVTYSPP